ncbi:MAG: diguanylate cyclase [Rhodospirillaceae bacterium]|nr:diguanylate cyclase [Rhodospirillaceae bacterium]
MNRHPGAGGDGTSERLFPVSISVLIFAFAAALIVLFALAMLYVGMRSSDEADRRAYESDLELFDNTLNNRFALLARDQYSFAGWNRHLAPDAQGVGASAGGNLLDRMAGALWYPFGHDRTLLINPDGSLRAYAGKDAVGSAPAGLDRDPELRQLIAQTQAATQAALRDAAGDAASDVFTASFQTIEGEPALLSAMALPDATPDAQGRPAILIAVKFIDGDLLEYLNAQLAFNALHFNTNPPADLPTTHKMLTSLSGGKLGAFIWADNDPGAEIWSVVWPLIVVIGLVMAVAALLIARKLGGMTNIVEHSERRTRYMARHDPLTGLANRLAFGEALMAAVDGSANKPFAVIACDLDRFKAVNDTYGHAAGDTVIREVAARMASTVGNAGLVSRTGGDEFIILMQQDTDPSRLADLGRRLIAAVTAPIALGEGKVTDVGVSLGIAPAPGCGQTAAAIMRAADEALYEAKATGRGRLVFAGDRLLRQEPTGDVPAPGAAALM